MRDPRLFDQQTENWRSTSAAPQNASSRAMLACTDGSYLPLITKYESPSGARVLEIDVALCPDVQISVQKIPPAPVTHAAGKSMARSLSYNGYNGEQIESQEETIQQRINNIVTESRQLLLENGGARDKLHIDPAIATPPIASSQQQQTPPTRSPDKKEFCTHWIRTGECDYVQQGCRYKHEMPSLAKLKAIGFPWGYPRWWTEKVLRERPNVRISPDENVFKHMVDAHLQENGAKEVSRSSPESEVEEGLAVSKVRPRVASPKSSALAKAAMAAPKANLATKPTAATQPTGGAIKSATDPSSTQVPKDGLPIDLLDLLSDSEPEDLAPALPVFTNSRTPSVDSRRKGRFIPYNESRSIPTNEQSRALQAQTHSSPSKKPASPPTGYEGKAKEVEDLEAELAKMRGAIRDAEALFSGLSTSKYAPGAGSEAAAAILAAKPSKQGKGRKKTAGVVAPSFRNALESMQKIATGESDYIPEAGGEPVVMPQFKKLFDDAE